MKNDSRTLFFPFALLGFILVTSVCVPSCRNANSPELQNVVATQLILETVASEIQLAFERHVSHHGESKRIPLPETLVGAFLSPGQAHYLEYSGPSAAVEVGIVDSWGRGVLITKHLQSGYCLMSAGPNQMFDSSFGGSLSGDDLLVPIMVASTK